MKAATPVLSAEQKRASEKYQLVFVPALMGFFVAGFFVLEVLLFTFVRVFYIDIGPGSNPSSAVVAVAFFAAHHWAIRKVREAGLSLESKKVEVLADRKTDFRGEVKEWWHPKTFWASVGNAIIPFVFVGASWWLWHVSFFPSLNKVLGIVTFWPFLSCGVVGLIFLRAPHVRIDDEGITAFPHPFWRRRAHWRDIARCEIRTRFDYMGRGPIRFFIFRNATGKVLLRLIPGSFMGLSREEQAEIEREVRRRLGSSILGETKPAEES